MNRILIGILMICLLAAPALAQRKPPREVLDTDVDRAIKEAKRYLWGQQLPTGFFRFHWHQVPHGGPTALALLALLEIDESVNDPKMKKSLTALAKLKTNNVYVITTRTMVMAHVIAKGSDNDTYKSCLKNDVKWITNQAGRFGAWGYTGPQRDGDNSCSQFALLALWEADRAGVKIPPALIRQVERIWLRRQRRDGGWTYAALPDVKTASTLTMTAAALASLYICQDVLIRDCRPYANQKHADKAWEFLAKGLAADIAKAAKNDRRDPSEYFTRGYLFFCVQRVGMTTGRKFIGDIDWFAVLAEKLCAPNPYGRSYGGKWGPIVRAAFELLFLSRGRIPLTFNKLRYGEEKVWNFHTRDIAHFTEYMRRTFERPMRWQIVKITDEMALLLDAPILLVAGLTDPKFTDEQWNKLREYSLRGGTLLLLPNHGGKEFVAAVKKKLEALYEPDRRRAGAHYTLRALPADHPIYTCYRKLSSRSKAAPMWGVSDGTRLLAVICERDLACPWHRRDERGGGMEFDLGVNFFMVTTGRNKLSTRLRPVFHKPGGEVRHRVKVAWLTHGGNWATQPYALDAVSQKTTSENRVAIDVTVGAAIDAKGLAGHDLAWMTGTDKFKLTAAQVKALRDWIDRGGTLFLNAVGGANDFNDSVEGLIDRLYPAGDVPGGSATFDSPLMTGKAGDFRGPRIGKLKHTYALKDSPLRTAAPLRTYMRSGRSLLVHARLGIHDTLDGHTTWGAKSFRPDSARDLAANIVLYALSLRGTVKPPAPATQPAK